MKHRLIVISNRQADELQQPLELKQDPELLGLDAELMSAMKLAQNLELESMLQTGLDLGTELKLDPTLSTAPQIMLEPDPTHSLQLASEPDLPQDLQQLNMEDMEIFRNNINIDEIMPNGDPLLAVQSTMEEAYMTCPSHFDVDGPLIPSED